MQTHRGSSHATDADEAVDEATKGFPPRPDIVFAFCSTRQSASGVAKALQQRFPDSPIAGCSSSGEIVDASAQDGSVVVAALTGGVSWATSRIDDLKGFNEAAALHAVSTLFARQNIDRESFDPGEYFCLLFIDGISLCEENVSALVADALEGVTLVGGSAGDDLGFRQTFVLHGGEASTNAAVLVLGHCPGGFQVIKHQHFQTSPRQLAVTRVDAGNRRVYEMDGFPALSAYAAALGLPDHEVTAEVAFLNPLCFNCDGQIYVRSVRTIETDGSLVFYCAIEEGMVLEVGNHERMATALDANLSMFQHPHTCPDFLLIFNCILRQLEAKQSGCMTELMSVVGRSSTASMGFDTYGEQLHGLHMNQTFVALALRPGPGGG